MVRRCIKMNDKVETTFVERLKIEVEELQHEINKIIDLQKELYTNVDLLHLQLQNLK